MPARKHAKVSVTCPKCGHQQLEPREAYSTVCKKCNQHIRLEEVRQPVPTPPRPSVTPDLRKVVCFDCETALEAPVSAESTMCKRCGRHVDLRDYEINQAVSRNFRTHGRFVIEPKGNVFNTEAVVGDAVIKGKFLGKLNAWRTLTILSGAQIKGTIQTGCLIIPEGNQFRWPELTVERAEISGELVSTFKACGTILLKATAVLFGDVEATNLVVEPGAVWVGDARIGQPPSIKKPSPQPEPEPKVQTEPQPGRHIETGSKAGPAAKPKSTRSRTAKPRAAKTKTPPPTINPGDGNLNQQELMP